MPSALRGLVCRHEAEFFVSVFHNRARLPRAGAYPVSCPRARAAGVCVGVCQTDASRWRDICLYDVYTGHVRTARSTHSQRFLPVGLVACRNQA